MWSPWESRGQAASADTARWIKAGREQQVSDLSLGSPWPARTVSGKPASQLYLLSPLDIKDPGTLLWTLDFGGTAVATVGRSSKTLPDAH